MSRPGRPSLKTFMAVVAVRDALQAEVESRGKHIDLQAQRLRDVGEKLYQTETERDIFRERLSEVAVHLEDLRTVLGINGTKTADALANLRYSLAKRVR